MAPRMMWNVVRRREVGWRVAFGCSLLGFGCVLDVLFEDGGEGIFIRGEGHGC